MNTLQSLISAVMNAAAARLNPGVITPPPTFFGQHTNPKRNAQRQDLRAVGKRQYKKYLHAARMSSSRGA